MGTAKSYKSSRSIVSGALQDSWGTFVDGLEEQQFLLFVVS